MPLYKVKSSTASVYSQAPRQQRYKSLETPVKMYRHVAFSLAFAATSMAQIPTNLTFHELTTQYLPFISINTDYIFNDTRASQQLANAKNDPVTIFLSLNIPFEQFLNTPPPNQAAGEIEKASQVDATANSDLFQYIQLDGLHRSTSFSGTSILKTRFNDTQREHVTGGQKLVVYRNDTSFYMETGIGFKSNVVIPVSYLNEYSPFVPLMKHRTSSSLVVSSIS